MEKFCWNENKEKEIGKLINNTNINAGNFVVKKNELKIDEEIWYRCYDKNGSVEKVLTLI